MESKKPKITVFKQIKHLEEKGVKFTIMDRTSASVFLSKNNFFFKLKSYAKNFDKGEDGKYLDLDFAYLVELSKIDMYFRRLIILLSLDIEHYLKVWLINKTTQNQYEDGYNIVSQFMLVNPGFEQEIEKKAKYSVTSDLISHYKGNFAVWNIVEVIGLHELLKLTDFYMKKYKVEFREYSLLWSVRFLRNGAAHNNCLLNSLKVPYKKNGGEGSFSINKWLNSKLGEYSSITKEERDQHLANPIVHDFVALQLVIRDLLPSKSDSQLNAINQLGHFIHVTCVRKMEYFTNCHHIRSEYEFVRKVFDNLFKGQYNLGVEQK